MTPGNSYHRSSRALRAAMMVVVFILALPYILTLFYRVVDPPSTLMIWRWLTGRRVERIVMPIGGMSPVLPMTVLVAEDARFCSHAGVDFQGLWQILEEATSAGRIRGGSTITQQTAKNLFLWQGRSVVRKVLEFPLALWIDLVLPKRRIMEIYLNIAEWGPEGQFGAESAARRMFGKSSRDLNQREAAALAAVLPDPVRRSGRQPRASVQRLAGIYEARAVASSGLADCLWRRRTP